MVFGINDKSAKPIGVDRTKAQLIVDRLASLCRDGVDPLVSMDHELIDYKELPLLFVHIRESAVKPVHLNNKTIEDSFIRSGGEYPTCFQTRSRRIDVK